MRNFDTESIRGRQVTEIELENGVSELIAAMDNNGISSAVAFPYPLGSVDTYLANGYVVEAAEKYPDRIIPFVLIDKDIKYWISRGVRGFKHHSGLSPRDIDLSYAFKLVQDYDLPLLMHVSRRYGEFSSQIRSILSVAPKIRLIVAHMGRWVPNTGVGVDQSIEVVENVENIYFETSTTRDPIALELAVRRLGEDRVIFGTDCPFNKLVNVNPIGEEIALITGSNLSEPQKEKVLSLNIKSCLRKA